MLPAQGEDNGWGPRFKSALACPAHLCAGEQVAKRGNGALLARYLAQIRKRLHGICNMGCGQPVSMSCCSCTASPGPGVNWFLWRVCCALQSCWPALCHLLSPKHALKHQHELVLPGTAAREAPAFHTTAGGFAKQSCWRWPGPECAACPTAWAPCPSSIQCSWTMWCSLCRCSAGPAATCMTGAATASGIQSLLAGPAGPLCPALLH